MQISKYALLPALTSDQMASESAAISAQTQINNIQSIAVDNSINKGKAYDASRAYLEEVRIPLLMVHLQFFSQFTQDIKNDLTALPWLPWGFGDIIDTVLIEIEISALNWTTHQLEVLAYSPGGLLIPDAVERYQRVKAINDDAVRKLEDARSRAIEYANNSSIYAGTRAFSEQLDQATKTLAEVGFDQNTGTYDLSGITDASWKSNLNDTYWEHYNYVLLSRYFILDENGNPIMVKPEMANEIGDILNRVFPYVTTDENGINLSQVGNFADGLSYDEKYLLLYLTATYGDAVYSLENYLATQAMQKSPVSADVLASAFFEILGMFGEDNAVSHYLSFIKNGGTITSHDSPTSFQANGGFSDFYDLATKFLGMDIDTHITVFTYGDKEYRLQVWDGQYMSGIYYGGEIGLYSRSAEEARANPYIKKDPEEYVKNIKSFTPTEVNNMFINYESVRGNEQIPMVLNVYDSNSNSVVKNDTEKYIDDGTHYWDFAITPNDPIKQYDKNDLNVVGELTFDDPGMRAAAKEALIADGHSVEEKGNTLKVYWE